MELFTLPFGIKIGGQSYSLIISSYQILSTFPLEILLLLILCTQYAKMNCKGNRLENVGTNSND